MAHFQELKAPGYNAWTIIDIEKQKPTNRVLIDLKSGVLDHWNFGKKFGIRQLHFFENVQQ